MKLHFLLLLFAAIATTSSAQCCVGTGDTPPPDPVACPKSPGGFSSNTWGLQTACPAGSSCLKYKCVTGTATIYNQACTTPSLIQTYMDVAKAYSPNTVCSVLSSDGSMLAFGKTLFFAVLILALYNL